VNKKIDGAFGLGMRDIQVAHTMGFFYTQEKKCKLLD
jgi:hypothetical protein